ncbi:mechanosensitive ion channel family protein [Phytohabitans kaempferiae]|uniref:Transporter n=1 Tax=Phytohabitans kaempferiae TaxID=1620943 RepID=A0ABV6LXI2_9ACTN
MSEPLAVRQVDIDGALTDMWRSVFVFLPKAVAFLAILFVGWIVARFIRRIVHKALKRVGLDRAIERGGMGRAFQRSKYDASTIASRIVYYALLLLVLQIAFAVWGPNPVSALITSVVAWLPRAFVAIVIVVVAIAIANAVRDLVSGALGGLSYGKLLATLAWAFIIVLGAIAALNQVGIATTVTTPVLIAALATIAGILIVGVGGGLVRPMQQRWEGLLDRAATESQVIREKAQAYNTGRDDAGRQMADRAGEAAPMAMPAMSGTAPGSGTVAPGVYQSGEPMPPRANDETQRIDPQQ